MSATARAEQFEYHDGNASMPLRAVVLARQPIARAGLRGLVADQAGIAVVGQAASTEEAVALALDLRPDVLFGAWQQGDADDVIALIEALGPSGVPLVLLGDAPAAAELGAMLRAGARGFLLSDATAEDVSAALVAVARGLLVLDPLLGRALPRETPVSVADDVLPTETLTDREREVLQLLALGLPNKAIARRLSITEHTVKFHVGSILAKLGASSRTEAVTRAARHGILAL